VTLNGIAAKRVFGKDESNLTFAFYQKQDFPP